MTSACEGPRGDTIPTSETTTTPNSTAVSSAEASTTIEGDARAITGAGSIKSMLLPPCTNISVYAQTSSGAEEAAAELGSDPA